MMKDVLSTHMPGNRWETDVCWQASVLCIAHYYDIPSISRTHTK